METKTSQVLGQLISALWRRRVLLLTPLLVMLPLSLLGAKYLPKTYIASALMVMQESNRDNPFLKNSDVDITLVKRVEGLEAWLKSEHIMSQILQKYTDTDPVEDPAGYMYELEEMRKAFSLKLVGNDFLKFQLKDGNPKGLGAKLEAITSRFLEGLLVPDKLVENATQVVLKTQKRKLEEMKRRQRNLQARYERKLSELRSMRKQVTKESLLKKMANPRESASPTAELIPIVLQDHSTSSNAAGANRSLLMTLDAPLTNLAGGEHDQDPKFTPPQDKPAKPLFQLAQTESSKQLELQRTSELSQIKQELILLNEQVLIAEASYEVSAAKLDGVNVQNPLGILNAPEGIKIIDPPKDPARPSTSALKIILAGLVSAVFLGMGLATMAEILDQRVSTSEKIAEFTGMPITGRLPSIDRTDVGDTLATLNPDARPG